MFVKGEGCRKVRAAGFLKNKMGGGFIGDLLGGEGFDKKRRKKVIPEGCLLFSI